MYSVMMEIVKDFKRTEINFISLSKKIKTYHVSSDLHFIQKAVDSNGYQCLFLFQKQPAEI